MVAQKASYRYMNNQLDKAYRIYTVIAAIPYGNVISYGDVARLAGLPRGARLVGWVLKKLPEETQLPWHRVVNAQGKLISHNQQQRQRLLAEGITFKSNSHVDLKLYGWIP